MLRRNLYKAAASSSRTAGMTLTFSSKRTKFDLSLLNPANMVENVKKLRENRKEKSTAVSAEEKQMARLKVVVDQEGASVGPTTMEGKLFYAIDDSTLKSYVKFSHKTMAD